MKKILIVIPNYNGFSLISNNLPRINETLKKRSDTKVVIVDDGSKTEEVRKLEKFLGESRFDIPVTLIKHKINHGFSSAVNTGAFSESSDYILFLNSDAVPENDFLDRLVGRFGDNPQLFAVGCMDKSIEPDGTVLRGRGIGMWKRGILVHKKGEVDDKTDTFWVSGGSSMVDAQKFKRIKGFDTIFDPFYWEDIDLSYRAQKAGYKLFFDKSCVVEHRHEEGAIKTHYKKNKINTTAYRNQFIFLWKSITDTNFLIQHIIFLPYHLVKAIFRWDTAFLKGFFLALLKIPVIIEKKHQQKKYFVLHDKEIIFKTS